MWLPIIFFAMSSFQGDMMTTSDRSDGASTREVQYNRLLDVADRHGRTQLGLMMNQAWHDDPKRLTFTFARYKFVARLLSGRKNVLKVGCGDAFPSRIVQQEVERLTVTDFDPIFIECDVKKRRGLGSCGSICS
jgi:hypothetical protein